MKAHTKSEETRARILEAAIALFRGKGFAETTMREIAGAAGVATGGLGGRPPGAWIGRGSLRASSARSARGSCGRASCGRCW